MHMTCADTKIYLENFLPLIKDIPNVEKLSKFDDRKLIKLWEGLGYYSRVRNLKKTAQIVVKDFNKRLPKKFMDLKSLPGIGDYTASAISAIAFNEPIIPLDGNIERVLKRYLYLKKQSQIKKVNLQEQKKIWKNLSHLIKLVNLKIYQMLLCFY